MINRKESELIAQERRNRGQPKPPRKERKRSQVETPIPIGRKSI